MVRSLNLIRVNHISYEEASILAKNLKEEIKLHNKAYYEDNKTLISDAEYDKLFKSLLEIESKFPDLVTDDSPSKMVGFKASSEFAKYQHKVPMLSLGNAFSEEDIGDFIDRIKNFLMLDNFPEIFCEPKIDGLSFSATYEKGILKNAATRGDGFVGEDITENIKTIKNFPRILNNLPDIFEVRGEIYIDKNDFLDLNKMQESAGKAKFVNPRNAAAGSLRQLDPNITASRPLKYFVYSTGFISEQIAKNQEELLQKLTNIGFVVNPFKKLASSIDSILSFYKEVESKRENLDYEIDGVVYKLNDFAMQERMGFIARSPRFAIAHKFPAIIGITNIIDIVMQVGRTGAITPVAELTPIFISGVTVSRATLHNYAEIKRKDIRIGDYVYLQRSGDVIPKINAVDLSKRENNSKKFIFPNYCPSCNSPLNYEEKDIIITCKNKINCPAQNYERICHFVSRDALNIDGLGKKQIEFLLEKNLISNHIDIFFLKENNKLFLTKLENMDGWGIKSVENLFENIERAKKTSLSKFIYSLGIDHIGEVNAKLLAKEFFNVKNFISSMEKLVNNDQAIYQKLDRLHGIGHQILVDIVAFFALDSNILLAKKLSEILIIDDYIDNSKRTILTNKIIVFTGSLHKLSRAEAKSLAEKFGAKTTSYVSSSTDLVVAGSDAGSKLKKAKELNIRIINEDEWLNLIKEIE